MPLARDGVLRLMKDRTQPICASCLAADLETPFARVFDALLDIEFRRDYPIRPGTCGECGEHHQVIRPHPLSDERNQAGG